MTTLVTSWIPLGGTPPKCNAVSTPTAGGQPQTAFSIECPATLLGPSSIATTAAPTQRDNGTWASPGMGMPNDTLVTSTTTGDSSSAVPHPPSQTAVKQTNGLEGRPVAGLAIGMLLAGILIASVAFFYLLRRQKKRQVITTTAGSLRNAQHTGRNPGPEKGATLLTTAASSIDDLLPQPVEDDTLIGDLSKIRDSIKNHVRTFYHVDSTSAVDLDEESIQSVAALMSLSGPALANALSDPSKRDSALRSVLAAVILVRCTGDKSPNLLPKELSVLAPTMTAMGDTSKPNNLVLYSKWKTITGALLQQRYGRQSQNHTHDFQDTIAVLDVLLGRLVRGSIDGGQRRKNLDMILTRAAKFAFLLFAQPGSFQFDLSSTRGGLTVFPALVQTIGDQGQPLSPVEILAQKECAQV